MDILIECTRVLWCQIYILAGLITSNNSIKLLTILYWYQLMSIVTENNYCNDCGCMSECSFIISNIHESTMWIEKEHTVYGRSAPGRSAPFTGQSAPSNLRGGKTEEMGRIDHGGVRGRSAPLEWVDLMSRLAEEAAVAAVTTVSCRQCRQSLPGLAPYPDESLN